ncbi:hypothetical protein FGG08_004285 [Glutinoglossum americanum]|uniref:ZZ-type domain-containing protein n=1 Tax=Glutinoglossum americanum TaxID=1670608 RepID=A0A9P8I5F1_9PEZI|nr:hypothetical protein FGG08_004285 [Glutinoglossum americanum]
MKQIRTLTTTQYPTAIYHLKRPAHGRAYYQLEVLSVVAHIYAMASEGSTRAQKRRRLNFISPALDLGSQLHSQPAGLTLVTLGEAGSDALTTPPPPACSSNTYLRTLRVRGLSATHSRRSARTFLRSKLALDEDSRLEICSLASSPHQHEEKVATITFEGISNLLPSGSSEWMIDMPGNGSDGDDEQSTEHQQHIIIDSHFEGFTPMDSAEKDEDHGVEYPSANTSSIVAVSGLGSHAFGSFKERGGQYMWLRDALPDDIPSARVLIYGYHTKLADSRSFQDLEAIASTFRVSLGAIRNQYRALIQMSEGSDIDKFNFRSTCGILFFGVPNQGVNISSLIPMVEGQPNMLFLLTLGKESGYLRNQHRAFCKVFDSRDCKIISFYETEESPTAQQHGDFWSMTGPRAILVDSSSATHGRPWESEAHHIQAINRSHSDIVKFSHRDKYYYVVLQHLRQLAAGAASVTETQFSEIKGCLQSLSFPEFGNRLNDVCEPHSDTFQWIWKNEAFCQWLVNDKAIFWVQGKPGCGKSTLMKLLFQNRSTLSIQVSDVLGSRPIIVGYFFCGRGTRLERSMEGLLRSLLVQILERDPSLFRHAIEAYRQMQKSQNRSDGMQWSISTLRRIFVSSVAENPSSRGIYLFIDALDECDGPLQDHVSFLQRVAAVKSTTKVCISGRPTTILWASLGRYPGISLPEETSRDIRSYVHEKTESLCQSNDGGGDDSQLLRTEIIQRANGVFLWVSLVVEELLKGDAEGDTINELRDRLSSIPLDLDGVYRRVLGGIEKRYVDETRLMLQLILCAVRPLTLEEFRFAIAFGSEKSFESQRSMVSSKELVRGDKEMEKRIRSRCGGLVEVTASETESKATVKFIHQSVKDFLLFADGFRVLGPGSESDPVARGHQYLLRSCIQYLTISELGELPRLPPGIAVSTFARSLPFISYATFIWIEHWKALEALEVCQSSQVRKLEAKNGGECLLTWITLANDQINPNVNHPAGTTLLYIATEEGIVSFIEEELRTIDVNIPRGRFGPLLETASAFGREQVVGILLQKGANVNYKDSSGHLGNAVRLAAHFGEEKVIHLLLNNGADANDDGGGPDKPLQAAAARGNLPIVQLLLENGADINARSGRWGSALQAAAASGHDAVVRLLLERGADVNADGRCCGTEIKTANPGFGQETAQISPARGADEDFQVALPGDREAVAQLLPHKKLIETTKTAYHSSAIQNAASAIDEAVARLLLDDGLDVNSTDRHGCRAIHWVAAGGWASLLTTLVEAGSDPRARDKQGRSALHHAATGRSADCVSYLLGISVDPNIPDGDGWTPLHWACRGVNLDAVKALVESGADTSKKTDIGWSPTRVALFFGRDRIVRYLVSVSNPFYDSPYVYSDQFGWQARIQPSGDGLGPFRRGRNTDFICDGCEQVIYGIRRSCSSCPDFDFCFKCIATSSETHPGHIFKECGMLGRSPSLEIPSFQLPGWEDGWVAAWYQAQM